MLKKIILATCFTMSFLSLIKTQALPQSRPHYDKKEITFKTAENKFIKKINVEVAITEDQHEYGLMNITKMKLNEGMLFIFTEENILNFWMKNTLIDLSIAYMNKDKMIVDIQEMKATNSLEINIPTYPSKKPAMYALEMNKGWFSKNNIKVGDKIDFK